MLKNFINIEGFLEVSKVGHELSEYILSLRFAALPLDLQLRLLQNQADIEDTSNLQFFRIWWLPSKDLLSWIFCLHKAFRQVDDRHFLRVSLRNEPKIYAQLHVDVDAVAIDRKLILQNSQAESLAHVVIHMDLLAYFPSLFQLVNDFLDVPKVNGCNYA